MAMSVGFAIILTAISLVFLAVMLILVIPFCLQRSQRILAKKQASKDIEQRNTENNDDVSPYTL